MPKICPVTKKKVMSGHNVSHANNKTKRKFNINMQQVSLLSETLGRVVRMRLTPRGLRTVEFFGGIDAYLIKKTPSDLMPELRKLRKVIVKRQATK